MTPVCPSPSVSTRSLVARTAIVTRRALLTETWSVTSRTEIVAVARRQPEGGVTSARMASITFRDARIVFAIDEVRKRMFVTSTVDDANAR